MPEFVVGNTEPGCNKLKKGKGFLKPNFEPEPSWTGQESANIYWKNTNPQTAD